MPRTTSAASREIRHPHKRGNVLTILAAAVSLGIVGAVGFAFFPTSAVPMAQVDPLTDAEVAGTLARIGLKPDVLTAAGVSASATTTLVGNVRTHLASVIGELRAADADFALAQTTHAPLARRVRAGAASQQEKASYEAATTALQQAESERNTLLTACLNAATAGLTQEQLAKINQIKANQASWDLPMQYMVLDRTEADFLELRNALAHKRINEKKEQPVDQEMQQIIAAANADTACSAALYCIQNHANDVKDAWINAVKSEE